MKLALLAILFTQTLLSAPLHAQSCQTKNVLWLGNSLSWAQPQWFRLLVEQHGANVNLSDRIVGGRTLSQWVDADPEVQGYIDALPTGEHWDAVIVQAYSYEPTTTRGNPAAYIEDLLHIVGMVRTHSPNAVAMIYQTAAYGHGHGYYPLWYAHPDDMTADVQAGCRQGVDAVHDAHGPSSAVLLPVGEAYAADAYTAELYAGDLVHGTNQGRLVSAMVMVRELLARDNASLPVQHGGSSPLEARLTATGIGANRFEVLASHADGVGRQLLGSHEDLALAHRTDGGTWSDADSVQVGLGQQLELLVHSPNGDYVNAVTFLLMHVSPTGSVVAPPGIARLHIPPSPLTSFDLIASPGASGASTVLAIPASIPMQVSLRVQAASLQASPCSSNPLFTTTHASDALIGP